MSTPLRISDVRRDGGTQVRAAMNEDVVTAYAEAIGNGDALPPITVYRDGAGVHWLADGFHRVEAHLRAGAQTIDAGVLAGTQRDAVLHAVGANAEHGLRRSNEDKRRAVGLLLGDPEWAKWSDRKIADACHVSNTFVSNIRKFQADVTVNVDSEPRTYVTKHGTEAVMNTAAINADRKTRLENMAAEFKACEAVGKASEIAANESHARRCVLVAEMRAAATRCTPEGLAGLKELDVPIPVGPCPACGAEVALTAWPFDASDPLAQATSLLGLSKGGAS